MIDIQRRVLVYNAISKTILIHNSILWSIFIVDMFAEELHQTFFWVSQRRCILPTDLSRMYVKIFRLSGIFLQLGYSPVTTVTKE